MSSAFLEELPHYYRNIREFRELSETVTTDWDKLDEALFSVENDQFILTSSEAAILIREKDFGIRADPKNEPLKFRKLRLLARMQENAPYVLEYLIKVLTGLLGENNHQIFLDINEFEMEVTIGAEQSIYYNEIVRIAERIVPLNIDLLTTILLFREHLNLYFKTYEFNVPYPFCNMFQTDTLPGKLANGNINIGSKSYTFDTYFPICNTFVTSTVNSVDSRLNVELTNEYRDINVLYHRASQNTVVGEGEI